MQCYEHEYSKFYLLWDFTIMFAVAVNFETSVLHEIFSDSGSLHHCQ